MNLPKKKDIEKDPILPQLIWIAYEKVLMSRNQAEINWLTENASGNALVSEFMLPRVMRRLVASGKPEHFAICLQLIAAIKDASTRQHMLSGLMIALKDQTVTAPAEWKTLRDELLAMKDAKITALVQGLSVSFRDPEAIMRAVDAMLDIKQPKEARAVAIRQLGVLKDKETLAPLLVIATKDQHPSLRVEAIRAVAAFDDAKVPTILLNDGWPSQATEVKAEIIAVLASRKTWAKELLLSMNAGRIDRQLVTDNTILRIQAFKDAVLDKLIEEAWGRSRATPADLVKQIDAMRIVLASGPGSFSKGRIAFENHCGKCHRFDGKGSDVGPALDGAARDIEYLLANVLDPNRVIGAPYFVREVATAEGQIIQGMLAEEDDRTITLKVENAVLKKFVKADLDKPVKVLERSIMPEGLTGTMKPEEFRDLIRYVMAHPFAANAKVNGKSVPVPVTGLIPLPEVLDGKSVRIEIPFTANAAFTAKLLVGSANAFEASLDGMVLGRGKGTERRLNPDSESLEAQIRNGEHKLVITVQPKWDSKGLYVRFLDPDRRISYQE